jgi:hypothetical protein
MIRKFALGLIAPDATREAAGTCMPPGRENPVCESYRRAADDGNVVRLLVKSKGFICAGLGESSCGVARDLAAGDVIRVCFGVLT